MSENFGTPKAEEEKQQEVAEMSSAHKKLFDLVWSFPTEAEVDRLGNQRKIEGRRKNRNGYRVASAALGEVQKMENNKLPPDFDEYIEANVMELGSEGDLAVDVSSDYQEAGFDAKEYHQLFLDIKLLGSELPKQVSSLVEDWRKREISRENISFAVHFV